MKNLVLAVLACTMAVFTYAQKSDGIVYWSYEAGYHFDFDLDGKIDLTVPTQTKDVPIAEVFVYDANGDGYFDLCEVDRSCSSIGDFTITTGIIILSTRRMWFTVWR